MRALCSMRRNALRAKALAAAFAFGCALPLQAQAQGPQDFANGITTVEVFANSAMLITPAQSERYRLVIHRMDRLEQVQQAINQQLPKGGEAAARAWIAANEEKIKRQVRPAAIAAANAINLANHYRLDRLPAMVINRQAVVYGVVDVDVALEHYRIARGGRP